MNRVCPEAGLLLWGGHGAKGAMVGVAVGRGHIVSRGPGAGAGTLPAALPRTGLWGKRQPAQGSVDTAEGPCRQALLCPGTPTCSHTCHAPAPVLQRLSCVSRHVGAECDGQPGARAQSHHGGPPLHFLSPPSPGQEQFLLWLENSRMSHNPAAFSLPGPQQPQQHGVTPQVSEHEEGQTPGRKRMWVQKAA